jgi:hypothetical protein
MEAITPELSIATLKVAKYFFINLPKSIDKMWLRSQNKKANNATLSAFYLLTLTAF